MFVAGVIVRQWQWMFPDMGVLSAILRGVGTGFFLPAIMGAS
jgi:hypothetical protein